MKHANSHRMEVKPVNSTKSFINEALDALKFKQWTPVQELVIPALRKNQSAIVQSVTGSGKTHSYLVPLFEKMDPTQATLQAVISAPTRELAKQIFDFAKQIASFSKDPIDVRLYTGGTDREREIKRLEKSIPMIAIGTPGKLKDFVIQAKMLPTHQASILIIDEADMTMDEGFLEDVDLVAATLPKTAQVVVVSATIPDQIQPFLKKYLHQPLMLQIEQEQLTSLHIRHTLLKTKEKQRIDVLKDLTQAINPYLSIVFCNTKESAEVVFQAMDSWGKNVVLIHGGVEPRKRRQIIKNIHELKYQYIVATDIISRGMDIDNISHIINYELPEDVEFYVHRSGRTGRMAKDGECISLYGYENDEYLNKLVAKGLHPEYRQLSKGLIVDAPARNQRSSRQHYQADPSKVRRIVGNRPTTVKPGYKKKYNEAVQKATKKIARKSGNRP